MGKVAKIVTVSLMTRVIVDENASDHEIIDVARSRFIDKIETDLDDNIEDIYDDGECPYDPDLEVDDLFEPKFIENKRFVSSHKKGEFIATIAELRYLFGKEQFNIKEANPEEHDGKTTVEWNLIHVDTNTPICLWDYKQYREVPVDEGICFSIYWTDETAKKDFEMVLGKEIFSPYSTF